VTVPGGERDLIGPFAVLQCLVVRPARPVIELVQHEGSESRWPSWVAGHGPIGRVGQWRSWSRPARTGRPAAGSGRDDTIDAEIIAGNVLSGQATAVAKDTTQTVEAIRCR
jgi:hypothetical protein